VTLHLPGNGNPARLGGRDGEAPSLDPSRLPPLRTLDLRGRTSAEVPLLTLAFAPSGVVLEGTARIAAASWTLWKRPFRDVEMRWAFSRQQWALEHLGARSPGTGKVRGRGSLALASRRMDASRAGLWPGCPRRARTRPRDRWTWRSGPPGPGGTRPSRPARPFENPGCSGRPTRTSN